MSKETKYTEAALSVSRNSKANLEYYDDLIKFYEEDSYNTLLKLRSFAVYTPRQVISDFLARYFLFEKILDLPGSVVECGVFNGQGLMSFAHFSAIFEPNHLTRKIIGFDTFEGFKSVSEKDASSENPMVVEGGMSVDSFTRLQKAINLFDSNRFLGHVGKIELVKGDILKTLDAYLVSNPQTIVALLYLDVDIYEPTRHALNRLLQRVPKGGIVAFDELNLKDFPGETMALMDEVGIESVALRRVPFCSRISYFVR